MKLQKLAQKMCERGKNSLIFCDFNYFSIGYSDDIYTFPYFCAFLLKRYLAGANI